MKAEEPLPTDQDARPARGGWAPGQYCNRCVHCHVVFVGDKQASTCADCAYRTSVPETVADGVASDLAAIVAVALDAGWTGEGSEELAEWLRERLAGTASFLESARPLAELMAESGELAGRSFPSMEEVCRAAAAELSRLREAAEPDATLLNIREICERHGYVEGRSGFLSAWIGERLAEAALARNRATDGTPRNPELVWAPSPEDLARAASTGGDLLPCPFCGSWPLTTREVNQGNGNVAIRISCPGKGLVPCSFMVTCVRADGEAAGRANLYARWNVRPPLPGGKGLAPSAAQLATACDSMAAAIRRTGGVSPAIADEFEALLRAFDALDEEDQAHNGARRLTAAESADLLAEREGGFQTIGFVMEDANPTLDCPTSTAPRIEGRPWLGGIIDYEAPMRPAVYEDLAVAQPCTCRKPPGDSSFADPSSHEPACAYRRQEERLRSTQREREEKA